MTDSEDHPSEEPMDSPAFPEEYSEALTRLRNSLVHQSSFAASESFKRALEGIRESNETRQRALQQALESFQTSYAPFRLRAEISALEKKAHKQADEISKHTADKKKAAQEIDKLRGIIDELTNKQGLQHLLSSVSSEVHEKIESDEDFRHQFISDAEVNAFVVSVDIRRSTELMLKALPRSCSPTLLPPYVAILRIYLSETGRW